MGRRPLSITPTFTRTVHFRFVVSRKANPHRVLFRICRKVPGRSIHTSRVARSSSGWLAASLSPFAPRRASQRTCGLERPTIHFGHGTVCKSGVAPDHFGALPASKLRVGSCSTSMLPTISPRPWVTLTVTGMVTRVSHAPVTFPHEKRPLKSH